MLEFCQLFNITRNDETIRIFCIYNLLQQINEIEQFVLSFNHDCINFEVCLINGTFISKCDKDNTAKKLTNFNDVLQKYILSLENEIKLLYEFYKYEVDWNIKKVDIIKAVNNIKNYSSKLKQNYR